MEHNELILVNLQHIAKMRKWLCACGCEYREKHAPGEVILPQYENVQIIRMVNHIYYGKSAPGLKEFMLDIS